MEIDEILADLHLDISELGKVLDIFYNNVGPEVLKDPEAADADHWTQVKSSLDDLAATLKTLESNLEIDANGVLRHPVTLIKLNWKGPTIQRLQQKIAIYTRSTQLSISFIT